MRTASRILAVLAFLLAPGARSDAPAKPPSSEDFQVAHLQDLQWTPSKLKEFPAGALLAIVAVDPQTGGPVGYGKFPSGSTLPAHWHSFTEYTVLVSGKATFTVEGKSVELSPGDYVVIPAKAHHRLTCDGAAPCVVFTRRAGPADYHFDN